MSEIRLGTIAPKIILGGGIEHTYSNIKFLELEYIQSSGNSYITTNIRPNGNEHFKIEFTPLEWSTSANNVVAGARTGDTLGIFIFGSIADTYGGGSRLANFGYNQNFTTKPTINVKHTIEYNKEKMYYDGTEYTAENRQLTQVSSYIVLCAGATDGSQGVGGNTKMKLHSFIVYNSDGTIKEDWRPCRNENDNSLCMFDVVNEQVKYTNGPFTAGPIKPNKIYLGNIQVQ